MDIKLHFRVRSFGDGQSFSSNNQTFAVRKIVRLPDDYRIFLHL